MSIGQKPNTESGGELRTIGRYRIDREIGRGAMGKVFLAHDPNIGRKIALKTLSPAVAEGSSDALEFRQRFVLEARAAGRLNHPNIVTIHDAAVDPSTGIAYIAMEFVEGPNLEQLLRAHGQLTAEATAEIGAEVAIALAYAHRQGVVHRDIKPANLVVDPEGRIKILDFGVAKLAAESHTVAGQILGTPAFMAPEQVKGRALDGRSDLFSLGAVLYACLAGSSPFRGDSLVTIAHKVVHESPAPLGKEVPPDLAKVLRRALEKEPERRLATGLELAEALKPFRPAEAMVGLGRPSRPATPEPPASGASTGSAALPPPPPPSMPPPFPTELLDDGDAPSGSSKEFWRRNWRWLAPLAVLILGLGVGLRSPGPPEIPIVEPREEVGAVDAGGAQPESSGDPAPAEETSLVVLHENRLRSATMTIWIDGEMTWSRPISARGNFLNRARGQSVRAVVPVSPGDHTIEVRVTGANRRVDAAEIVRGRFVSGRDRHLRAKLVPGIDNLILEWE